MKRLAVTLAAILCASASAQQTATPLPSYDAVTIKPNVSVDAGTGYDFGNATFSGTNVSVKRLIAIAYEVREGLVYGLPSWADSAHFDVSARVTDAEAAQLHALTRTQRRQMLAAVLADRFHLHLHTESRTLAVYELVVAKGGSKLTPIPEQLGLSDASDGDFSIGDTQMTASDAKFAEFAVILSRQFDRTVIDKTGLTGRFNFTLRWTPDNAPASDNSDAPPTLLTALQDQLGLRLQPAHAPVPTLVIDHIEQPTAN